MNPIVLQLIVWALEFLLHEAGDKIDWPFIRATVIARVRIFMPGDRFDDAAAFMAGVFIDLIERFMRDGKELHEAAEAAKHAMPYELAKKAMSA